MPEYLYDVALSTPLGIRRGTMKMLISGEQADGWLRLLGHQEPFYGRVMSDGSCDLYGKIITFMRSIEYTAQGSVNSNQLHLELQSKQNHFALNGTGRPLREENTQ